MSTNTLIRTLAETSRDRESVFAAKVRIFNLVRRGALGDEVLMELLPDGEPLLVEKAMWDYKESFPVAVPNASLEQSKTHAAKMAEIVKDVVAFYNSHGGYLIAGVTDNPRQLVGFNGQFDCGDLAKKVKGATNHSIDCNYAILKVTRNGKSFDVGVLQIPQRPHTIANPVQFLKDAPQSQTGKQAYKQKDIYFRDGDQSRPASSSDDYSFLCVTARRDVVTNAVPATPVLSSNLGPRDPSLVRFIGREDYLRELWKWLCDPYSPVKLLSGLGGLGKTTIAREFAQIVTVNSPLKLELVIWLSAKRQFFVAVADRYEPAAKVDFFDLTSLLRSLLCQLGLPEDKIDSDATRESLIEDVVEALSLYPSLVIVDDVDSLELDQQLDVFQTMIQIISRTMSQPHVPSRALLTARLQLGAAPSQLLKVEGLPIPEFIEYVEVTARSLNVPLTLSKGQWAKFHVASSGSPAFAASILRLMQTGDSFGTAVDRWNGAEGDQVRRFAFSRELDKLTSSQIRTLYAMCILRITSQLELSQVLDCTETRLRDDLAELRKYHLYAFTGAVRAGGAHLEVPATIRLMQDIIRERIPDPTRIENECSATRRQTPRASIDVGPVINRVIALWREEQFEEALSVAKFAGSKNPKNPDLQCLLGRAYLKLAQPDAAQAGLAFRNAHKLGCDRPELFSLWIESRTLREDWLGVIEITRLADKSRPTAESAITRAQAFLALAQAAEKAGLLDKAAKKYAEGGFDADRVIKERHLRARFSDLNALRADLMFNYVRVADRQYSTTDDHIYVWLAFLEAFGCFVRRPLLVRTGVSRLSTWWESVMRRGTVDLKASELMKVQLGKLAHVISTLQQQESPDANLLAELEQASVMLQSSWAEYTRTCLNVG